MNSAYRTVWSDSRGCYVVVAETARSRRKGGSSCRSLVTLSLVLASALSEAAPVGGHVTAGSASIAATGTTTTINQNTARAIIDWSSFSIAGNETVRFNNGAGATLNRVAAGAPASIVDGLLSSSGSVYLINSSGVIIGRNGEVRVGGSFVASTQDLSNNNFMAGGSLNFSGNSNAAVTNLGKIGASGGDVVLIAAQVANQGSIQADNGRVGLLGGYQVLVKDQADQDGRFVIGLGGAATSVSNAGLLQATAAELRTENGNVYALAGNTQGLIRATEVSGQGGQIWLSAPGGSVQLASGASLDASAATAGSSGGSISIQAAADSKGGNGVITLDGTMTASASGGAAGSITVSGRQIIESGAIHADGTRGGNVTVQGAGLLQSGTISADGGAGQGGAVALSTQDNLIQTASAKTSANSADGAAGTVQLTSAGSVFSSGQVTASGQHGGTISALGKRVALAAADFEANGVQGGGHINIGGGLHGSGPQTADTTVVNASTKLAANATGAGDGGQVAVWSDTKTTFLGSVTAQGGQHGGNGGLIEVSSGDRLIYGGVANASASAGAAGKLLLDPKNITISASAGDVASANLIDPDAGSGSGFGTMAVQLSGGSYVVTKPNDTVANNSAAGSVFFYNGTTGALMSAFQGSHANDQVGSGGLLFLNYQNWYNSYYIGSALVNDTTKPFLILSPSWNGGAGAISWVGANGSLSGTLSSSNSLVGSTSTDAIGGSVSLLPNNNYVSIAPQWNTGKGAVTLGSAASGITGVVSSANSLVGSNGTIAADNNLGGDQVGSSGITILSNGNFVVDSPYWNKNAGAVTLVDQNSGLTGTVSAANSLVGNAGSLYSATCTLYCFNGTNSGTSYGYYNGDGVGSSVQALSNGYYAVISSNWGHGRGAVTIANGSSGVTGTVSAANSLVGTTQGIGDSGGNTYYTTTTGYRNYYGGDAVGSGGVTDLGNGNAVVSSTNWSSNRGATTFMSLASPLTGAVSSSNSLVGSTAGTAVGYDSTYHQNYISNGDQVGTVTKLGNNNYVVTTTAWNGHEGAVTFASGTTGISGAVSSSNSLVGSSSGDNVGSGGVVSLSDNDYVVLSPVWSSYRGAVTRGSGSTGVTGSISSSNSIVGTTAVLGGNNPYNLGGDQIGSGGIVNLNNGDWVVLSPNWAQQKGAVTLMTASQATSGNVSASNSLVGTTASTQFNGVLSGSMVNLFGGDQVGSGGILTLSNNGGSNYLVLSPLWGGNKGAISFINPSSATVGAVSSTNSLVGQYSGTINTYNYGGFVYKQYENGDAIGTGGSANYFYKSDQNLWMTNVVVQANNDYVVFSPLWNNNRGAVSFGNGSSGTTGVVGSANSLVGSTAGTLSRYAEDNGTNAISTTGGDQVGYGGMQYVSGNNYLIFSSQWNSQAGAVTYVSQGGSVTGTISSSNSLVGGNSGDQVGSGGVTLLSGGDYVISSPSWNGGLGAATWSNSTGGITGTVSTDNSLSGVASNSSQTVSALNSGKQFLVARSGDGSGTVTLAFTDPTLFTYGYMSGLDVTIAPSLILQTLNSGTSVTLQANNDITVNSALSANSGSTAGLTLDAGRSILVNAAINTGNGNLTLTANDTAANNVVNVERDSGTAAISVASGANLSAGSGTVNITLGNGAGNTNSTAGNITLASSIDGADISVKNLGTQNGSITLSSGAALTASGSNGTITLQTGGNFINNAGSGALSVPNGKWLVYSAGPSGDTFGNLNSNNTAVWDTAAGATVSASGNRYVFAYQPHLTVTSHNDSKTYGVDASSAIQSDYTISGLQPAVSGAYLADTAAMVYSGAPSMSSAGAAVAATVAGGPYTISGATGTLSVGNGYGATTFTNSGQLTVNPATLVITAADQTATYGTPYTLSTALNTGYTQTGLVNNDTISGLTEKIPGNLTATTASTAVGSYTITPSAATGTGLGNYTIQYHTGTLTLQPAVLYTTLNYSVANAFSTYGTLATLGGATLSGILNNDQVFGTVGAFTQGGSSVTLAANTPVGNYVEKVTGLTGSAASNYVLASSGNTNGTLTIQPLAVTLSGSQTYNGTNIAQGSNLSVGNRVGSDSITVGGSATLASAHAGNQALSGFSGLTLDNSNYTLTGASGSMTVNPLAVTLTGSQTYNGTTTAQGSNLTVSNQIVGDTVTVGGSATLASAHAGSRALSGFNSLTLSDSDYTLTGATGSMTVNPMAVTLTGSQTYNGTTTAQGSNLTVSNQIVGDIVTVGGSATLASAHAGSRALSGFNSLTLSDSDYTL
uniref:two-partner secretion domain-containing protein n=1 Tax=Aquitalea magnusonii TaxID=332411 RepID=UPI000A6A2F72